MSKAHRWISALWIATFLFTGTALCQGQQPLAVQKIKGNVYMVKGGSGANTGFFVGDNEVVVIDAKMTADSQKQVIQEIKNLTSKPITKIILTHSDGDHVNGLNAFPVGLKIYSHPQTKKDMEDAAQAPNMEYLREYLPNEICSPGAPSKMPVMTIPVGNEKIELYFFGPAHTSGDLIVYFPAEKVAFVGDLVFTGRDPLIHRFKGGTSSGLVETLQSMLRLDADPYLSGHSDPLSKQDIQSALASITEKRDKVKTMVAEGKSLEEIKKAFGVVEAPAQPGRMRFMSLVEVIFLDLTEKK